MFGLFLNEQQKYFKAKLSGVQKTIWDLEFKRFKTREIREEIRVEYDQMRARLAPLEDALTKTKDKKELAALTEQKAAVESDANRFMAQMKHLDAEVAGSGVTEQYPDGLQGINQQLDALRELQQMIKEYIKIL
jgi:predicted  nucleic acid-binding Zn-ribbon protein